MACLKPNVSIFPEGLIRIILGVNLVFVIVFLEWYYAVLVPFYLVITVISNYDPVKKIFYAFTSLKILRSKGEIKFIETNNIKQKY